MKKNHVSQPAEFDLETLFGPAWRECRLTPDGLHVPVWRRPFPPDELRAMFWRCQQVAALEHALALARRDLAAAEARADAADEKAAQLRRLVVAESRLGLAFFGITSDA